MFYLSKLKIFYTIPVVLGAIVLYSFAGIFLFKSFNYVTDFFFFPVSLMIFTGAGIGINYIEEKKQNTYITNAFGKYVNKALLNEIIQRKKELKLGGEKKDITVFFTDIRGFTNISEKMSPDKLGNLINQYLTEMGKIILENNGTIDKFIGDAIMAFWNAPVDEKQHAFLACKTVLSQFNSLKEFNKTISSQGIASIKIGCGINTGEAVVGNFGSDDRFDYTALGDTVNLASRLEGLTKHYGVDIIISETCHNAVKDKFKCRKLDLVKVKGKQKPVCIYELCTDYNENFVQTFEKALELYLKTKFSEAKKQFKKALELKEDAPCKVFIERCDELMKNPPEKNWDGSFEMKEK